MLNGMGHGTLPPSPPKTVVMGEKGGGELEGFQVKKGTPGASKGPRGVSCIWDTSQGEGLPQLQGECCTSRQGDGLPTAHRDSLNMGTRQREGSLQPWGGTTSLYLRSQVRRGAPRGYPINGEREARRGDPHNPRGSPLYLKSPATTGPPQYQGGTLHLVTQFGRVSHYPRGVPLHLRSQRTRGAPHNPGKVGSLCLSREEQRFPTSPRESPISGEDTQGDTAEGRPSPGEWGSPRREHGAASTDPAGPREGQGTPRASWREETRGAPPRSQGPVERGSVPGPAPPYRQAPRWQGSSRTR